MVLDSAPPEKRRRFRGTGAHEDVLGVDADDLAGAVLRGDLGEHPRHTVPFSQNRLHTTTGDDPRSKSLRLWQRVAAHALLFPFRASRGAGVRALAAARGTRDLLPCPPHRIDSAGKDLRAHRPLLAILLDTDELLRPGKMRFQFLG